MSQDVTETGWVVEHGPTAGPVYMFFGRIGVGWTLDSFKAVRFARRADAETALALFAPDVGRVVEHAWDA